MYNPKHDYVQYFNQVICFVSLRRFFYASKTYIFLIESNKKFHKYATAATCSESNVFQTIGERTI